MNLQLTLAMRYLTGRKLRTALTTLAVAFGVMVLFGLNTILPAMLQAFQRNMLAGAGQVDMAVTSTSSGPFSADRLDDVRDVDGIDVATGSLQREVILPSTLGQPSDAASLVTTVSLIGIDPTTAPRVHNYPLAAGRFLAETDAQAVLVPQHVADKVRLGVGDHIILPSAMGTTEFTVAGIITTAPLPGVDELYVTLPAAQAMLNLPGQISAIEALFTAGVDRAATKTAVLARLGDGFQAGTLESGSGLVAALQAGQAAFGMFGAIALAMGVFIIYNTFRTLVAERQRDIGMLRAVGANRRMILGLILAESMLQGLIGTALGLLAGYGLAAGMITIVNPSIQKFLHMEMGAPTITTGNLAGSIAMGLGITLLGGLLPALSAARVTPLDALRPMVTAAFERAARRRSIVGAVLVILAVLALASGNTSLAGLGTILFLAGLVLLTPALVLPLARTFGRLLRPVYAREGRIAEGNLARQPNRAAITASVLMIGLAASLAMAGVITSISDGFFRYLDRSLGSDLLIMPSSLLLSGGNVGAAPELARQIEDTPGISGVTSLRLALSRINGGSIQVIGVDPQTYPQLSGLTFSSGDPDEAFAALDRERAVIVNGITAAQGRIKLGQTLSLQTSEGAQDYRVMGIANDYLNAKLATVYASQANLERDFHQTTDLLIMANLEAGASAPAVRQTVADITAHYPAFTLVDFESFREMQKEFFGQATQMLYVMIVVLAVPALLAMINTLVINVIERTREIGVLRAVGSTRRQVGRLIRAESLLLAAIGTAFGILAGLWLGYVLVKALNSVGFTLSYFFPWAGILLVLAAGLLVGVLAASLPARRAARLNIITALRYE